MSRTATATPPPPFFPPRHATPSMRHCSAPNVTAAHFATRHQPHHTPNGKRRTKGLPTTFGSLKSSSSPKVKQVERMDVDATASSEDGDGTTLAKSVKSKLRPSFGRSKSDRSVISLASSDSFSRSRSNFDLDTTDNGDSEGHSHRSLTPTPSLSATTNASLVFTPVATPASSRASSLFQKDDTANSSSSSGLGLSLDSQTSSRGSWGLPNFGKIVKAVGITFGEKRGKNKETTEVPLLLSSTSPSTGVQKLRSELDDAVYVPRGYSPKPYMGDIRGLTVEQVRTLNREWALSETKKIQECARLCSQWPQSGYNMSKWGPNGSKNYYEPQSYANPEHVASVMEKQAGMERDFCSASACYFQASSYPRHRVLRSPSSDDSDASTHTSERSSPATSMHLSVDERRGADIKAAMASPLISPRDLPDMQASQELDAMAGAMVLCKDEMAMDVDLDLDTRQPCENKTRERSQSCGAKRPLGMQGVEDVEEEKRRKVDEAMVVEEAVASGVIIPPIPSTASSSIPDSNFQADQPPTTGAMFGHIVKTSDTHPIIISSMFPPELLPVLSQNLIIPPTHHTTLKSKLDIPSLLFSYAPNPSGPGKSVQVPSPLLGSMRSQQAIPNIKVGNLLLSSCPGKRLRMEGPCKGRGPVCRDLKTDLKRVRGEGVGLLVCCLDDSELELLGVPWESYREAAAECGLDILRLPMPDGFTPVSLSQFDNQINLITTQYTLKGINTLVHCRGGIGRAGLTACAWTIKMGFASPHPSLLLPSRPHHGDYTPQSTSSTRRWSGGSGVGDEVGGLELEHQMVMSVVERVIAMIRCRRGMKAIESFEQVGFLVEYVKWLRAREREGL